MSADEPVFSGVSLEQHAGVSAALAEDLPLAEVLAQEGIEEASWTNANKQWRVAIADGPDLQVKYLQKRRVAEDCLRRPIEPLDDDAACWVGLLAAVKGADESRKVLEPLGLRITDIARLGRHWQKKAAADPAVTKQLIDLAGKAAAPTVVKAEPARLKPFPWTSSDRAKTSTASAAGGAQLDASALATPRNGVLPVEESVDLYAALAVVLQLRPGEKASVLALCGLQESRYGSVLSKWRQRLDADPALHAEFTVRTADHRSAFRRLLAGAPGSIGT